MHKLFSALFRFQQPQQAQRKHRWWAGTASLLGSLKRRKKQSMKSRPALGRIPHLEPPDALHEGHHYLNRQGGHGALREGSGASSVGGHEFYGSCYSTVGTRYLSPLPVS